MSTAWQTTINVESWFITILIVKQSHAKKSLIKHFNLNLLQLWSTNCPYTYIKLYIFRGSWALSFHFDWKYIYKNLLNMLRECGKQFCWQGNLDECTDPWGIRVERVEMWVRLGRSFLPHLYTQHAVMVVVMWLRLSFLDPIEYLNAWS